MSPDFDELVEGIGSPAQIAELREVHELLLASSPPAEFPVRRSRRRGFVVPALIAAAVAAGLGLLGGWAVAGTGGGFHAAYQRSMSGVPGAAAVIAVGREDSSGNRALEMSVRGLPQPKPGKYYEVYLTRHGKKVLECGVFRTGPTGSASVTMAAPGELVEYGGWVVTADPGDRVVLST